MRWRDTLIVQNLRQCLKSNLNWKRCSFHVEELVDFIGLASLNQYSAKFIPLKEVHLWHWLLYTYSSQTDIIIAFMFKSTVGAASKREASIRGRPLLVEKGSSS